MDEWITAQARLGKATKSKNRTAMPTKAMRPDSSPLHSPEHCCWSVGNEYLSTYHGSKVSNEKSNSKTMREFRVCFLNYAILG